MRCLYEVITAVAIVSSSDRSVVSGVYRQGSMVTMDMRMDRVRVWCNEDGIVTRPPRVG
ncbi:unnamed protein product [Sphacelaria rigidula]